MTNFLPRLLITGAEGQLGQALINHPLASTSQIIPCSRSHLDITKKDSIAGAIAQFKPDVIINAAAYTYVDKAEVEGDKAYLVNYLGAQNLAKLCGQHAIPLIHLSTDYVFDGQHSLPYAEEDQAHPINIYGKSKWLGEQTILENCRQYIILRISGVFSEYGNNFFKTMVKLGKNNTKLRVVADQITCPTYAGDIAATIFTLAQKLSRWGIYHYCSFPAVSWHEFAEVILNRNIEAITTAQYPTAAKRPIYSVLNCDKINEDYGIKQPLWKKAVEHLQK